MTAFTLRFDPSGTGHAFFTEAIDLSAIGRLDIQRATTIEFHNGRQVWEVKDAHGQILFAHPSRSACLHWEHEHFNRA
jgi:hypothetical protein